VLDGCPLLSPAVIPMLHIVNQSYDRTDKSSPDEVSMTTSLANRTDYNKINVFMHFYHPIRAIFAIKYFLVLILLTGLGLGVMFTCSVWLNTSHVT
jgi:hypothetical protein